MLLSSTAAAIDSNKNTQTFGTAEQQQLFDGGKWENVRVCMCANATDGTVTIWVFF